MSRLVLSFAVLSLSVFSFTSLGSAQIDPDEPLDADEAPLILTPEGAVSAAGGVSITPNLNVPYTSSLNTQLLSASPARSWEQPWFWLASFSALAVVVATTLIAVFVATRPTQHDAYCRRPCDRVLTVEF